MSVVVLSLGELLLAKMSRLHLSMQDRCKVVAQGDNFWDGLVPV